jgi:hypothetical protein
MKAIVNLNLLDPNKIIIGNDLIFIVIRVSYNYRDSTCTLEMIEITKGFATYSATVPVACNRDLEFISVNDKDWVFKFYETDILKEDVSKFLRNELRSKIDLELKTQK